MITMLYICGSGIDAGLMLTLNVEQFEDIEEYAQETGILVELAFFFSK